MPKSVDDLESREQFRELVQKTRTTFAGDYHLDVAEEAWHDFIHELLCQSGYYLDLAEGKTVTTVNTFSAYCAAFEEREARTSYIAPIKFVSFAEDCMDFGTFQIARFSTQQLDTILRNRVRRVFYPWTMPKPELLNLLSQFWFIYVAETGEAQRLGHYNLVESSLDRLLIEGHAERVYTNYPKPIETALRALCLFDWPGSKKKTAPTDYTGPVTGELWWKFEIPFVIKMRGDMFFPLEPLPYLDILGAGPFGPLEYDDAPFIVIQLDDPETKEFKTFIRRTCSILNETIMGVLELEYVNIALGYFTKAFLSQPSLEQLLWYVTSIEALLGEKGAGVSQRLSEKIGLILGKTKTERDKFSRMFQKTYGFRNNLVHGARFKEQADFKHLLNAYMLSRRIIIWFLRALNMIHVTLRRSQYTQKIPTREEILMLVDLDVNSRELLQILTKELPRTFPYMADWID